LIFGLIGGVFALWLAVNRRTYPIRLQNLAEVQGRKALAALKRGDDPAEELRADLERVTSVLNCYDRWSSRILTVSLVLFVVGILAVAVAGWPEATVQTLGGTISDGS